MSRPIRPRPPPETASPATSSRTPLPTESSAPPENKFRRTRRGKITTVACEPCRKSKTKCDGRKPVCLLCRERGRSCRYEIEDRDRNLAFVRAERNQKELENITLLNVVDTLKKSDEQSAHELLKWLRRGGDIFDLQQLKGAGTAGQTIAGALEKLVLPTETGATTTSLPTQILLTQAHTCIYRDIVGGIIHSSVEEGQEILRLLKSGRNANSVSRLIASKSLLPPLQVLLQDDSSGINGEFSRLSFGTTGELAKEYSSYTTESSSDDLVESDVQQDMFDWHDITADKEIVDHLISLYFSWQHSMFVCFPESLFRLHMQAGSGAYCSSLLVASICATASIISDRKTAKEECAEFLAVALRLMAETHQSSLATIAASCLLSHVQESQGKMSSMWQVSARGMRMAMDLQLHLRRNTAHESDIIPRTYAFWGSFIIDTITSFTIARLPNIPVNAVTVGMPEIDEGADAYPWYPFGIEGPGKPGARSSTFNHLAALSKIINSTLSLFFAPTQKMTAAQIVQEHQKYINWFDALPPIISQIHDAPPHVLCLHMQYHAAVLLLFRPFIPVRFVNHSDTDPRNVCDRAAKAISEAFEEHTRRYDHFGLCTFQVHCLLTACTIHIINAEDQRHMNHLAVACRSFHTLAPKIGWAAACLHIVSGLAEKWKIELPQWVRDELRGGTGEIPPFEYFSAGEAASYLLHNSATQQLPLASNGAPFAQQQAKYLFSPFPYQQLPLLDYTTGEDEHLHSYTSANNAQPLPGAEYLGEDWFAEFVSGIPEGGH
ncbi:MAG: hypothetical protein M1820_008351 [Bogoriella megaspora]|nr:MAG: hypothetical protein M1820_008351 [Bogoriella megaspora]